MATNYQVPFYSNTPDDTLCWQAALRMVLKYFEPNKEFSWQKLDEISEKIEGLWTWPSASLVWLSENNYEVTTIGAYNHQRLVDEGSKFLYEEFGEEAGKAYEKYSDINQGRRLDRQLIDRGLWEYRILTVDNLVSALNREYLPICTVNAAKLNQQEGFVGHSVVVKGYDDNYLILHDPDLPPQANRVISFPDFEAAWASPSENAKDMKLIKVVID